MRSIIFGVACLLSTSCWKPHPPEPREPEDPLASGGGTPSSSSCGTVCSHAGDLGCSWAEPTKEGASCVDVCENVQQSGILRWDLACRQRAPSCDAMEACD